MTVSEGMAFFYFILIAVLITMPFRYLASRISRLSASDVLKLDKRKPLLYLRSFKDDKMKMKGRRVSLTKFITQSYRIKRIDELLAEYFWHQGPVIAVQSQAGSGISVRGPALEAFDNDDWQTRIQKRIDEANLIVVQMNETEGVQWEFRQCLRTNIIEKTIFVFGLQAKKTRQKIISDFLAEINGGDQVDLSFKPEHVLAAHYDGNNWNFHLSSKRTKFDYMAALLVATKHRKSNTISAYYGELLT